MGVIPNGVASVPVFCDNTGANAQAKEPKSHQKFKHVLRKYHILREIVERGEVSIDKVGSADNVADPLTKPLPGTSFEKHRESMGLKYMGSWLQCKWEIVRVGARRAKCWPSVHDETLCMNDLYFNNI